MKLLKYLNSSYGSKDISELVDFIQVAPIELPEDKTYYFEKEESNVNIYGRSAGIEKYNIISDTNCSLKEIKSEKKGIRICVKHENIESIVLHFKKYVDKNNKIYINSSSGRSSYGESNESRYFNSSSESNESNESSESRVSKLFSRSSESNESKGGESR